MAESNLKPLVPSELNPPLSPIYVVDGAGLEKVKSFLERKKLLGLDVETNITQDFYERRIRTIQVGDRDEQYVIDLRMFVASIAELIALQGNFGARIKGSALEPIVEMLRPALCSNTHLKVGHNLGFEYQTLFWNLGLSIWNIYDTWMVEKILYAGLVWFKLKNFWALDDLTARYCGLIIDKELQKTDWMVERPLNEAEIVYAALDTRLPLAIRAGQMVRLKKEGLEVTAMIENDAIGAFEDIHINGMKVSKEKWGARVEAIKAEHAANVKALDTFFIPVVGKKSDAGFYDMVDLTASLEEEWRSLGIARPEEKAARGEEKAALKADRLAKKTAAKAKWQELNKRRKELEKTLPMCEGEALINYDANGQLLEALHKIKGLNSKNLPDTNDDTLNKLKDKPVIAALRNFRKSQKKLSTYGEAWITEWTTEACNEEGWIHPKTGRIHSRIQQLEAETGRTSSVNPNVQNLPKEKEVRACFVADEPDELEPEGYVIVTVDMSGAELRIIADDSGAPSWCEAFAKGWDVHSVGTEILYPEKWPAATLKSVKNPDYWTLDYCKNEVVLTIEENGKTKNIGPCAYYAHLPNGEQARHKCDCPEHKKMRDDNKATNFQLAYGGSARSLSEVLECTVEAASDLMRLHEAANPEVWAYLERSGKLAVQNMEARDMFGRRRAFERPDWERAKASAKEKLKKWGKGDREPTTNEISSALKGLYASIERQGKNMRIQGTNASIIKRAMGCGFDANGKPYLWHILKQYKAKLINMVHDELVVQVPKRFAQQVLEAIGDAYARAAAEVMHKVKMEYEGKIAPHWSK